MPGRCPGMISRLPRLAIIAAFALMGAVSAQISFSSAAEQVPLPQPRPPSPSDIEGAADGEIPIPMSRPDRPSDDGGGPHKSPSDNPQPSADGSDEPTLRPATMLPEELACRVRLRRLGVDFEERDRLSDPAGCDVAWPISVSKLSADIRIQPQAVLSCALAERLSTFAAEQVATRASETMDAPLAGINHASAYVCRSRNGSGKLSEHAFGRALDIASFAFADGSTVTVGQAKSSAEAKFLLAVRLDACGPFTTVLGPGSDADHADHLHLDLAHRRPGSTFCQ